MNPRPGEEAIRVLASVIPFGAVLDRWLDRARPRVSPICIRFALPHEMLVEPLVTIPDDIVRRTEDSPWLPRLYPRDHVLNLDRTVFALDQGIERATRSLSNARELLTQADRASTLDEKRSLLHGMFKDGLIMSCIEGALARRESTVQPSAFPSSPTTPAIVPVFDLGLKPWGFVLDLSSSLYPLSYRSDSTMYGSILGPVFKDAAQRFSTFNKDFIRAALHAASNDMNSLLGEHRSLGNDIKALLWAHQRLVIDVVLYNLGHDPILFSPWAALRVFPSGTFSGMTVVLEAVGDTGQLRRLLRENGGVDDKTDEAHEKRGDTRGGLRQLSEFSRGRLHSPSRYVKLGGGEHSEVAYRSVDTLERVAREQQNDGGERKPADMVDLLGGGILECQLIVRGAEGRMVNSEVVPLASRIQDSERRDLEKAACQLNRA